LPNGQVDTPTSNHKLPGKVIIWQLFLIALLWLVFWLVDNFQAGLLNFLFGPVHVPLFIASAPFMIFLIAGVVIASRRRFPLWSYTWIGTLYFFAYRDVFDVVLRFAPAIMPDRAGLLIGGFYWIVNPIALALLLAFIARRDWLLACLAAYPYTTIIQAWYTLDSTPFHIMLISLILFVAFIYMFLVLDSRTLKFVSLLAGVIVIGGGFFLYRWDLLVDGLWGFIFVNVRHILIIIFPLIIYKIPLYHKLFKTNQAVAVEN
jgi:uncharacterized integral membrane protein